VPDDLDRVLDALHALPLELDARDIADALWLSSAMRTGNVRALTVPVKPGTSPPSEPAGVADSTPAPTSPPHEPHDLYDGAPAGNGEQRARRVRIRRPRALSMPLDMARSLRAFNRRWQAGRRQQLDLEASVAGYARTGQLTPIFRAAPERWFEATVLVDDSPSMALWRDTAAEFSSLLRQLGAFRSVRTLTLALAGDSPSVLNAAGQVAHPRQLRSSTGRRLVLVMSDCLADAWSRSAVWQTLWDWAKSTPTALVNPLPSSLWRRTGLDLPAVRVASSSVGGANTTLRFRIPWNLHGLPTERWLPLPTPALTAQSMRRWAATLMRADPIGADAVLVPPTGRVGTGAGSRADTTSLETFRHVASEEAFRLAVLSSPHDPVSLQMLDLLRDQLVPNATVSDMAEIIASGVATAERDAGHTVLRFRPELREQLQRLLSAPEAWRSHEILTDYVATHADTPGDLVLAVPDPTGSTALPAHLQPFADASRNTLRILGINPRSPATASAPPTKARATAEVAASIEIPVSPNTPSRSEIPTRIEDPASADSTLVRLLSRVRHRELVAVFRLVTSDSPPPGSKAADMVRALENLVVGTADLPKPIEFAEELARRVAPPLAEELRSWAHSQAQELGMIRTLRQFRGETDRPRPAAPSSAGGTLWPLVKALQMMPCMASAQDRDFVVRLLADRLGTTLQIEESPRPHQHILSIVAVCSRRPDGLAALLDVVRELDEETKYLREVERIIAAHTSQELWPEEERERLFALLSGMIFTDLVELYRQVAGPGAPELPAETSYRGVFLTLETMNADPDGLPKPIVFVEHLASGRRSELSIELRRWSDRQASRLGVITELQRMRREFRAPPPGPPPNSPAYLVFELRQIGLAEEHYQLRHWKQLDISDGWHPERGEDFVGTLDEVKRQIAFLIENVESKWARYQPDIRLEFVLPNELLSLDVDQWPWELDSPLPPVPLGCRYTVAIRSLERMNNGKWHRSWHTRWRALVGQLKNTGTIQPDSSYWVQSPEENIRKIVADLERNPEVTSLAFSSTPRSATEESTEVAVALRAGIPVIVWHREGDDSEEFAAAVGELLHADGPGTILQRLRHLRTSAFESHSDHIGHHLVVMWDDPERLVNPVHEVPRADQP
jgi:hypothetical protein